ncbi:hypothetical protein J2I47_14050 [Fibrella sp. HMF5335]|uniref:Uncharacterized protein n=1 Tax=Fibrella rubiginis TaxID=2817060 RepID=A0A939K5W3_9BACT|nr:hypothetical protein [Fibrella rubiginis]MBO0937676.1 hypothetical protein [Fibrella rubiginis]
MKYVFGLLALLSFSACEKASQQNTPPVYYDVLGYVKGQIDVLSKTKPMVSKRAEINEKNQQFTTRTINWKRELELFTQADINKPALRQSYTIARPDSLTYRYTLKPSEKNLTVRSLTVQLDSATRKPRQIEAVLVTKNFLYESERHILLESGPTKATQWGVRHYRLRGFQHLSVSDAHPFDVEGTVAQ